MNDAMRVQIPQSSHELHGDAFDSLLRQRLRMFLRAREHRQPELPEEEQGARDEQHT